MSAHDEDTWVLLCQRHVVQSFTHCAAVFFSSAIFSFWAFLAAFSMLSFLSHGQ